MLQVGSVLLKGYLETEWDNTLDAAGYPRTAIASRPKPPAIVPTAKPDADGAKPAESAQTPAPPAAAK